MFKIVALSATIILGCKASAWSQDISWMKGLWMRDTGTPYRAPSVLCTNTLEITEVADSSFAGLQTTFFTADTAIRTTYACSGLLTQYNAQFHRGNIVYKKNSTRAGFEWNNCEAYDARTCSLYIERNKLILLLTADDCDPTCNSTIAYYRELNDFDKSTRQYLVSVYYKPQYHTGLSSFAEGSTPWGNSWTALPAPSESTKTGTSLDNSNLPLPLRERTNKLQQTLQITSPYIEVILLDDAEIDGDIISLYDNNVEVLSHKTLGKEVIKHIIKADRQHAYHEIVLIAENLGSIPPNTARMRIRAGDKKYEFTTRANMHENAKVIIEYTGE